MMGSEREGAKMAENEQKTAERKKRELYENQKKTLDTFLERHAITRAQYEKSLGDLTVKMGFGKPEDPSGTREGT